MRSTILYIAISLDGYIADKNGGVTWLEDIPNPEKSDYGYAEFYDGIDTTIMGNKTYQQVLGFGVEFPYKDKTNFVVTRDQSLTKDENVQYVSGNISDFVKGLKRKPGKNIWCVGGASLNSILFNNKLIDEIQIFIMPILLGDGIPLAGQLKNNANLDLCKSIRHSSGVQEIRYSVNK